MDSVVHCNLYEHSRVTEWNSIKVYPTDSTNGSQEISTILSYIIYVKIFCNQR